MPEVAATFEEALEALRTCDRLCSLVDNQPHAIKNDKLLILALVQHTLTRAAARNSNLQPDVNVRVFEWFDTSSSAVLRGLDESNRSVQKSAESISM